MSVHNPNNWHWIDKNCLNWAKDYLDEKLVNTESSVDNEEKVKLIIKKLTAVTGDCDVTQRKGRVKCIFDLKVDFQVELSKEGVEAEPSTYNVTLPEFLHDQEEDEYDFQITDGDTKYKPLIRKTLLPKALVIFMKFQDDLLAEHQPKLQHNTD